MKIWKLMMMLFVLSATSVAFTACDKEDKDEQAAQGSSIVGTWVLNELGSQEILSLTFGADGSYTERYSYMGQVQVYFGTYTYANTILTVYYSDGDVAQGVAIVSGNTLTVDGSVYVRQ